MSIIKSYKSFRENLDLNSPTQYHRLIGVDINTVSNDDPNIVILNGDTVTIYVSCKSGDDVKIEGNINDINEDTIKSTVIDTYQIIFNFESGKTLKFTNENELNDLEMNIE